MPGEIEVRGAETGRVWRAHIARQLPMPGSGERRRGEGADGEEVLLHTLPKEEMYTDDVTRARSAIAVARRPEVRASGVVRQLVDISDGDYALTLVWEWADVALHELLRDGAVARDEASVIAANVRAALLALHALDLVHCDVAPNNLFRVRGAWKLGDLDSVRARGTPLDRFPPEHYRHPDAQPGAPADPAFDYYGLERIVERLRG